MRNDHTPLPRVVFFYVKDVKAKLSKITSVAQGHFQKNEPLLFTAQDLKSVQFLDELLWKDPEESFLPHSISESPLKELIVLTQQKKNLNNAKFLFNLCPTPLFFETAVKVIYEFEDATSPSKHQLSQQRFEAYKAAKYPIEAR
jgi:DNA polymerase III subunit chi